MSRWLELPAFLGMALLVHLLPFGFGREGGDAGTGGDGGASIIAMQAASSDLTALVAAWDKPPELTTPTQATRPEPPPSSLPANIPFETVPPAQGTPPPPAPTPAAAGAYPRQPAGPAPLPPAPSLPVLSEVQNLSEASPIRLAETVPNSAPDTPRPAALSSSPPPETAFAAPQPPERMTPPETGTVLEASPRPMARPQNTVPTTQQTRSPATPPKPAVTPSPATRAAGSGAGNAAGAAKSPGTGDLSEAKARNLVARWGGGIRARIARNKRYPTAAGRAAGTATVALSVGRDGRLQSVRIARSSGNAILDAAALDAVRRAAPFAPAPRGLADQRYSFTVPLRFTR
ncbi:TonB family protein [Aliiruegeria lutimaris]|uniref:Outer membrane transport energization protein TonB n=1 Tax=Aliiruegeria lutimaris TaxID=571298 RepID=A0A1G9ALI6_9RHOB|nr:TonB family protein [Aliiruegeria lutimaris]SDK27684.1 outer membrane transport energization protein TonB [Aliiruegeria lutimaris]